MAFHMGCILSWSHDQRKSVWSHTHKKILLFLFGHVTMLEFLFTWLEIDLITRTFP